MAGAFLGIRIRHGRFTVHWSRRAARFIKRSLAKMFSLWSLRAVASFLNNILHRIFFNLGAERGDALFPKAAVRFAAKSCGALLDGK